MVGIRNVTYKEPYKSRNLLSFYRGASAQFIKSFSYSLVALSGSRYLTYSLEVYPEEWNTFQKSIVSGTVMGTLAQAIISPIDLIKTNIMLDKLNRGFVFHLRKSLKENYFWRGIVIRTLRYGPGSGVMKIFTLKKVKLVLKLNLYNKNYFRV